AATQWSDIFAGDLADLLSRAVAVRNHPGVVTRVEVDRRDPSVRRLEEGQAARTFDSAAKTRAAAHVLEIRARFVRLVKLDADRRRDGRNVKQSAVGIECRAPPVRAAGPAGQVDSSLLRRRSEERTVVELIEDLDRFGTQLGREVDQVILRRSLPLV